MDDKRVKAEVMRELKWEPRVDAARIGVFVENGAVTLKGRVSSYAEKLAAVEAAERVHGVRAVADELEVELPAADVRDDTEIAKAIVHSLRWSVLVPDSVDVEVHKGHVRLLGQVRWNFQRKAAERAARHVRGVRSVTNLIVLQHGEKPEPFEIEQRVRDAIRRAATIDARRIWADMTDGRVHLHGYVHSLWEKKLAEEAARSAAGVADVDNDIVVTP
ncbi:MAG: BON domain-containing protein [Gaiellaceae bacterium]